MTISVNSSAKKGRHVFISAFLLIALTAVVAILASKAGAQVPLVVTSASPQGWSFNGAPSGYSFTVDEASNLERGALRIETPLKADRVYLAKSVNEIVLAKDMAASYSTKRLAGSTHAAAAYSFLVDLDGKLNTASDRFWAIYEPKHNNPNNLRNYSEWNEWSISKNSQFWFNGPGALTTQRPGGTLAKAVEGRESTARIITQQINQGTDNTGWKTLIDDVAFMGQLYQFEPFEAPQLVSPVDDSLLNAQVENHTLSWNQLDGATSYEYRLYNNDPSVSLAPVPIQSGKTTDAQYLLDSSMIDGTYFWQVRVSASSVSYWSNTYRFTIDKTAPDAPVLSGDVTRIMRPGDAVHSWAPSTATDVKNYIFKAFSSEADAAAPDTAAAIATETLAANQTSVTRATGTTDGTYWYRVAAVDNAGNKTWGDQVFSVTVDNTPPVTPTIAIKGFANGGITKARNHTVEWGSASADAATYTFEYSSTTNPTVRGLEDTTDRSWQGDLADGDGTYSMRVMAFDTVGNPSGWSKTVTIRIDGKAPKVTLNEIASTTAPATATLTGIVDDSTITEVTIMLNGVALGTRPVTNGTFSYPFVSLAAADYAIAVRATDEAKNVGEASIDFVVTNPVVPAAPVANPTGNDSPAPAGRTAVATPIAGPAPADDAEGEVFEPVAAQDRSAIESEATEAGQETKGVTDTRIAGDSSLMMWLGWIVALVLAMGWFWWMVAGRRRRREDE